MAKALVHRWVGWVSDRLIAIGFCLSVAGIVGVGLLAYHLIGQMKERESWVLHSEQAIGDLEELHRSVVSAESAGRGFLITGQSAFRDDYAVLERAMDKLLYSLTTFISDNALQRESAARLTSSIERRFAYLSALIGVRAERGFAAVTETRVGFGSAEMMKIHATLGQMKNEEKRLLALRIEDRDHQNEILERSLAFLVLSGITVMGLVFLHMNRLWLARKEAEARAIHLANHDVLTGLPNRRMLSNRMAAAIAHAARYHEKFAVLCFDLDGFKTVNDEHGHDAGDQLLNLVATRIRKALRAVDTVARVGGDEFVAVLVQLTKVEDSTSVADKLLRYVSAPYTLFGQVSTVGTSIGIAVYPIHGTTSEELLKRADMALYEAKAAGKGRYAMACDDLAQGTANPRSHGRIMAIEPLVEASS